MSEPRRYVPRIGTTGMFVVVGALIVGGCTSSSSTGPTTDASVAATVASSPSTSNVATDPAAPTTAVVVLPSPPSPIRGCLTNGTMSGPFEEKVVDAITNVNTQNAGENAPDAYYATSWGKNSIGYFAFGRKATVVVNGDGSWSGESGSDAGMIEVAPDGTGAKIKVTLEGSDASGQRAKPLTLDLVTKCGVTIPTTVPPVPVNTRQNVTVSIVEDTTAKTPS